LQGSHFSRCYRTSDNGYISVQCLEPHFYNVFLEKLELGDNADFLDQYNQSRWPALTNYLEQLFASKSRDHWDALFAGSDACVAPVLSPQEALQHPVNQHRKTWFEHNDVLQSAAAPRFSTAAELGPAYNPKRDEHRQEILSELNELRT